MNIVLLNMLIVKNKEITNCKHFPQNVKYKRHNHIQIRKQGLGDANRLLSYVYVCRLLSYVYVCKLPSYAYVCMLNGLKGYEKNMLISKWNKLSLKLSDVTEMSISPL